MRKSPKMSRQSMPPQFRQPQKLSLKSLLFSPLAYLSHFYYIYNNICRHNHCDNVPDIDIFHIMGSLLTQFQTQNRSKTNFEDNLKLFFALNLKIRKPYHTL